MFLIDSHTHLYLKEFQKDLDILIDRANQKNIKKFLLPNIDLNTIDDIISLCNKYPESCYPMIGLHPCSVKKNYLNVLKSMEEKIKSEKFIAIGEIGIDLYWDKSFIIEQKMAFEIQLKWAKEHKLPVVIHSRNSFNEIYEILKNEVDENLRGVFHCFSGDLVEAKKILDLNFFLGIGGILTFKNSGLDSVIKNVPIEKILIETDAPYLAPTPFRGKRNEPQYLSIIATKLCEIKKISMVELTEKLYKNTNSLFFN